MFIRNLVLVFSLFVLLVDGDLDSNDVGIHAMATDKDSTSDEAPTHEAQNVGGGASAPAANQVTAPEDKSSESEERGRKSSSSRSAKPQSAPKPQPPPPHVYQSPARLPISPAHVIQSPTLPPQPIIPQPKALVRNRTSKRRSRTNRRQIGNPTQLHT